MGDVRQNFDRAEFRCDHCKQVDALDERLLDVVQRARTAKGKPLHIVSGYRCPVWNRRVGGVPSSQHLRGRAADVPGGYATVAEWKRYGAVGIGVRAGRVIHVDVTPGSRPFVFDD